MLPKEISIPLVSLLDMARSYIDTGHSHSIVRVTPSPQAQSLGVNIQSPEEILATAMLRISSQLRFSVFEVVKLGERFISHFDGQCDGSCLLKTLPRINGLTATELNVFASKLLLILPFEQRANAEIIIPLVARDASTMPQ